MINQIQKQKSFHKYSDLWSSCQILFFVCFFGFLEVFIWSSIYNLDYSW
jgi:hypothetical protein